MLGYVEAFIVDPGLARPYGHEPLTELRKQPPPGLVPRVDDPRLDQVPHFGEVKAGVKGEYALADGPSRVPEAFRSAEHRAVTSLLVEADGDGAVERGEDGKQNEDDEERGTEEGQAEEDVEQGDEEGPQKGAVQLVDEAGDRGAAGVRPTGGVRWDGPRVSGDPLLRLVGGDGLDVRRRGRERRNVRRRGGMSVVPDLVDQFCGDPGVVVVCSGLWEVRPSGWGGDRRLLGCCGRGKGNDRFPCAVHFKESY